MKVNEVKKQYNKYKKLVNTKVAYYKRTRKQAKYKLTKQLAKPITYREFKAIYLDDIDPKTLAQRLTTETINTARTRRVLALSLKEDGLSVDMRQISKMSIREISTNYKDYLKDKYHELVTAHGFEEGNRLYQLYYFGSD